MDFDTFIQALSQVSIKVYQGYDTKTAFELLVEQNLAQLDS